MPTADIIKKWEEKEESKVCQLQNLDECIEWLKSVVVDFREFASLNENEALGMAHHGLGTWIRNTLGLWADLEKKPDKRKPIVQWFNKIGIFHPDDISSIILTSFHRHLNKINLNVEEQVREYIEYWNKNNDGEISFSLTSIKGIQK